MGQARSKLIRPFRAFNAENRAAKAIERRQKVAVAPPPYASTAERLSRFRQEHPEYLEALKQKNEVLNENLKKVYVESVGGPPEVKSAKRLPEARKTPDETEQGVMDPAYDVPEGRMSLKTALGFIGQYKENPEQFTAEKIARDYKLDVKDVENVLAHFKLFNLHIPEEMYKKNKDFKKIVEEQMKHSSSSATAASFRIPEPDSERKSITGAKEPDSDQLSPTKT